VPLKFTIPLEPEGKKEARRTRFGVHKHPETRAAMEAIATAVRQQYQGKPLDCPLRVLITAWRTRPKTKKHEVWADTKPDYDNIEKLIGDALEGILWVNDSRIVDGRCLKKYAPKDVPGSIEIEVSECLEEAV
jgi:Holliday junction resolvase RusA-like endonuclease